MKANTAAVKATQNANGSDVYLNVKINSPVFYNYKFLSANFRYFSLYTMIAFLSVLKESIWVLARTQSLMFIPTRHSIKLHRRC